jgi:hypothetical protein
MVGVCRCLERGGVRDLGGERVWGRRTCWEEDGYVCFVGTVCDVCERMDGILRWRVAGRRDSFSLLYDKFGEIMTVYSHAL